MARIEFANEGKEVKRPSFISKFCWDRDQSFALFVPDIQGYSVSGAGKTL